MFYYDFSQAASKRGQLLLCYGVVTLAVDWLKIKNDYINGLGSYRKLAEQYGVSFGTLRAHAENEKWSALKKEQLHKISTKSAQKTAEIIAEKEADRVSRLISLSDQLADRIEQAIQELDRTQVTHKTKTREIEYKDYGAPGKPTKETISEEEQIIAVASIVDRKGLQQVAAALKTIWDIAGDEAANRPDGLDDDGLLAALSSNAGQLFDDGDDSAMLPEEEVE